MKKPPWPLRLRWLFSFHALIWCENSENLKFVRFSLKNKDSSTAPLPVRTAETLYEKATLALAAQVAFFISCAYLVREFGKSEIRSVLAEK
ncbi:MULTISPECIES: hypothetical protein [Pseudomonas putida group]|uniref:hypothetical protein n=1 Tax=Pseudomonas putida group TaxID=136845 RepID=UPI0011820076|nr:MULTISPECIES: hypothetical protein [Pseudomonas putida group]